MAIRKEFQTQEIEFDYSNPLDRNALDLKGLFSSSDRARVLYNIWFEYQVGPQNPETAAVRRKVLQEWQSSLTVAMEKFFDTPFTTSEVQGREELVGIGWLIKQQATTDAQQVIEARRAKRIMEENRSRGWEKHIRRLKSGDTGSKHRVR